MTSSTNGEFTGLFLERDSRGKHKWKLIEMHCGGVKHHLIPFNDAHTLDEAIEVAATRHGVPADHWKTVVKDGEYVFAKVT